MLYPGIPGAAVAGVLTFGQLLATAALAGLCTVFFDAAYQAHLPDVIGLDRLEAGCALFQSTQSIGRAAGPGIPFLPGHAEQREDRRTSSTLGRCCPFSHCRDPAKGRRCVLRAESASVLAAGPEGVGFMGKGYESRRWPRVRMVSTNCEELAFWVTVGPAHLHAWRGRPVASPSCAVSRSIGAVQGF
jgi:hypothetical protein